MAARARYPLLLTIAALLCGCGRSTTAAAPERSGETGTPDYTDKHILRTYRVPPGHEKSLARLLAGNSYPVSVVTKEGAQTQFVQLHPQFTGDGYFVLSAPEGIHEGVRDLLDIVAKSKPSEGPSSVEMTYWLVLGWPAAQASMGGGLGEVTKPLEALGALGPMRFELLESLSLAGLGGEEAATHGRLTMVKQTASLASGAVELRLEIETRSGGEPSTIETALNLKPGQFAVLGQAGYTPLPGTGRPGESGSPTLFYLARARTLD